MFSIKKYFIGKRIIIVLFLLLSFFILSPSAYAGMLDPQQKAATTDTNKTRVSNAAGYEQNIDEFSLSVFLGTAIKAFLSLLGIIFIILILYAGYSWMTAGGDESKVQKAKDTIQRAIIGLVITVMAYAIWVFVYVNFI